jgi:phosphopantothenoylcysteine decarboxylase/phosphopantothenate--cysteine ligase
MTRAATEFVSELTFRTLSQRPVAVDMFSPVSEWKPEHIALADWADVAVVAPCTANVMAKLAHGLADDLLTCTLLACRCPVVLGPAMNVGMWKNPATQDNMAVLKSRGVSVVTVEEGALACGYEGHGRLASLDTIMGVLDQCLKNCVRKGERG